VFGAASRPALAAWPRTGQKEERPVFGSDRADATVFKRIARRVEDILEAARDREQKGQRLALEIDARFQLQDMGAVQFQLASAILEEVGGLRQEEVVSELLSLGLAAVLDGAAKAASQSPSSTSRPALDLELEARRPLPLEIPHPMAAVGGSRSIN
jgi:hypothetical protein